MVLRSFWRQNQLYGTHSLQENTILVNQFGWYKIIMANFQCVLSHYCTSFHETIYKGTNTCVERDVWIRKTPCFVIGEFPTSSYSYILTQPSSFVFNSPPRWRQHQRRLKTANKSKPATSPPPPVWNILSEFSFFIPWYLSNPWNTRFPSPVISIYGLGVRRGQKRRENMPDTVSLLCRIVKLQGYSFISAFKRTLDFFLLFLSFLFLLEERSLIRLLEINYNLTDTVFFISCPGQLNRWHCHWVSH